MGAGGWGNGELETYTSEAENASMDGQGNLVIKAIKTGDANHPYTSARIKTQGLYSTTYGKIEARIKIPYGQGIWPAFWMLGATGSWPNGGEIDIMENIGKEPSTVHGTIHGPGYSGDHGIGAPYQITGRFADDFHVFAVIWRKGAEQGADSIEFQVDGNTYKKITPADLPAGKEWVFNKPFFLIMNVAVGGGWPGNPDSTTVFPQTMTIDYVRVYQLATGPAVHKDGIVNAASYKSDLTQGALGSAFGVLLSSTTQDNLFDATRGSFPTSVGGVSVSVDGHPAPLTYISPTQVNFQVPWEVTSASAPVLITSTGGESGPEPAAIAAAAPSAFADANGTAILNCDGGVVRAGAICVLWGNGFGALTRFQGNRCPELGCGADERAVQADSRRRRCTRRLLRRCADAGHQSVELPLPARGCSQ